jgi:hypothetical protein
MVAGERREWSVPIHLLARDDALLAPFRALGWRDGAEPDQTAPARPMESFLADFLAAMDQSE